MSGGSGRPATAIVLFTDVVGSTQVRQALGDDQADSLRRDHDRLLSEALAAHNGSEVKGTGDGLMAVFVAAAEGVTAAVAMQQAIDRYNRRSGSPIGLRVGLSAGDVSWEGSDCFGTPVVEAARLCAAAEGGEILVSEIVRLLAGSRGGHTFTSVGALELKGLNEPVTAHRVLWGPSAGGASPLPAALEVDETVSFVGRVGARQSLERAWKEAATNERRRVVLVSGEPGVGKTRIAAELARHAHGEGATVLFGRCDEEMGVPYQPFAEAFSAFVNSCPQNELAEHLGPYGGELVRLAPELAGRLTDLPEPLRAEPETERYRLFEAIDGFLVASAANAPVVLLLDDLHWAAQPTLLLLRHLVRSSRACRLLVLGTYRDTDLGRTHPLAEMLADFRREANVERLDLAGLDAGEVAAFVEAAAGHSLDEAGGDLARRLYAETEGNPFFVGQVLRNLAESGALVQQDGRWVPAGSGALRLPEGVREVIGRRLSRLPPATTDVLEVAAVIGREFDDRLLAASVDGERDAVLDALERAEEAHLVEAVPGASGRHAFVHALVRSTLYEELATTRRLRLHRRVGEAIEGRVGSDREEALPELAHHFAEAAALGEEAKAADYGLRAAAAARAALAYEEAAGLCEAALAALDPAEPAAKDAFASLLLELEIASGAAGDMDRTAEVADRAADLARQLGRGDLLAQAALARNGRRVWADAGVVDEVLVSRLEEALVALPEGDGDLRARTLARLASELYFQPAVDDRRQALIDEAVAMARRLGDDGLLCFVLSSAQWVGWRVGEAEERLTTAEELVRLSEELGDREAMTSNCGWVISSCLETLQRDKYDAAVARFCALAEEIRQPLYHWWALLARGTQALLDGRLTEATDLVNDAGIAGQQWPSAMQMYGVQLLALRRALGGMEELLPVTKSMAELYPLIPAWRTGVALVCAWLGRLDEAREQLDFLAPDHFAVMPLDANWLVGIALMSEVANILGDADRAAVLYDLLLPHAELAVLAGSPADCLGSTSAFLAMAAAACGRWEDWERHATAARHHHELLRSPLLLARFALEDGRSLAARGRPGDRELALASLEDCLAGAEAIGMTNIVRMADELHRLLRVPAES